MPVEESGITEREPDHIADWMKQSPEHQEALKKQQEKTDEKFAEFLKTLNKD